MSVYMQGMCYYQQTCTSTNVWADTKCDWLMEHSSVAQQAKLACNAHYSCLASFSEAVQQVWSLIRRYAQHWSLGFPSGSVCIGSPGQLAATQSLMETIKRRCIVVSNPNSSYLHHEATHRNVISSYHLLCTSSLLITTNLRNHLRYQPL